MKTLLILSSILYFLSSNVLAQEIRQPNVSGAFYPENAQELSRLIDRFLAAAKPKPLGGDIFALISPHAGYEYSGQVAAYGYKLIRNKAYKTVVIIGPSHYYGFKGVSVYPDGKFRTPLGDLEIDNEFTRKLLGQDKEVNFLPQAFAREHSIEAQLPFLQKTLSNGSTALTISTERSRSANFKIVPIVTGDCSLENAKNLAHLLKEAIGARKDVLLVASTDMYHGYDYQECPKIDNATLSYLKNMDAQGLYQGLGEGKYQLCGGFAVVVTLITAGELGHRRLDILDYTSSALVTGKKTKGIWTVGYSSCVIDSEDKLLRVNGEHSRTIDREEGEPQMILSIEQRKKLLKIARSSIGTYLSTGKKLEVAETDPVLLKRMGAFVTLRERGELRGCIGNLVSETPLYSTVSDMAVESAVDDPRFPPVKLNELEDIEIEISALSPLERINSVEKIRLGTHGVLVKKDFRSGVFLPQVAQETGWTKEEFLSNLCAHKAGLPVDAWKDKDTEIYIFTAEVFSE